MDHNAFTFARTGLTSAYLRVGPPRRSARNVPLSTILAGYSGPYVVLDFDEANELSGIEIVYTDREEPDGDE